MISKIKTLLLLTFIYVSFFQSKESIALISNKLSAISARTPITKYNVDSKINMIGFLNHRHFDKNDQKLRKQITESLIEENLIFNQAKKLGISVSEEDFSRTTSFLLHQAQISNEELLKALQNKTFDKITLANFVKYQIMMQEIIQKKITPELQYTREEKIAFKKKALEKIRRRGSKYKIMILGGVKKPIAEKHEFLSCDSLQQFIVNNNYTQQTNDIFNREELDSSILDAINDTDQSHGFVINGQRTIAFCTMENKNETSNIPDETFDTIYKNELLIKAVKDNIENLKQNNFMLIKNNP
jgi:hypothetical protein